MKINIKTYLLLVLLLPLGHARMHAMEGAQEVASSYLITGLCERELIASRALVLASPVLRKIAEEQKSTVLIFEKAAENLHKLSADAKESCLYQTTIEFIESLFALAHKKKCKLILALGTDQLVALLKVGLSLELSDLVDLSLALYTTKLIERAPESGPPALTKLASQALLARHTVLELRKKLGANLQIEVLQQIPLTARSFPALYEWVESLNDQISHEQIQTAYAEFSASQYASLGAVALFMQGTSGSRKVLGKVLQSLPGQQGKVKLELLRWFLNSPESKLTSAKRFKLGWLLALASESALEREAIFDELALFMLQHRQEFNGFDLPECFVPESCKDALHFKARLCLLYALIQRLKKGEEIDDILMVCASAAEAYSARFLEDTLVAQIDGVRRKIEKQGLARVSEELNFAIGLIGKNGTPQLLDKIADVPLFGKFARLSSLLQFLDFSEMPLLQVLPKRECSIERKAALDKAFNEVVANIVLTRGEGYESDSDGESEATDLALLLNLVIKGADVNAQDAAGNTMAHLAFKEPCGRLLIFYMSCLSKHGYVFDMNRENDKNETPLLLMHGPQLKIKDINLKYLRRLARATGVEFSRDQLAKASFLLFKQKWGVEKILKMDEQDGKLRFRTVARVLNAGEGVYTITERIRWAWLLALMETKEQRIQSILADLAPLISRCTHDKMGRLFHGGQLVHVPLLLYSQKNLKELLDTIKQLKEGTLLLPEAACQGDLCALIELLIFSRCFLQCLYRTEVTHELNAELLAGARAMENDGSTIDDLIKCIIRGADIKSQDKTRNTVLHYAVLWGKKPVFKKLLELFGPLCLISPSIKNDSGSTLLHLAAQRDTSEFVRLLLEVYIAEQLDILAKDKNGHPALHYMLMKGWGDYSTTRKLYEKGGCVGCGCGETLCLLELSKVKGYIKPPPSQEGPYK